MTRSDAAVGNGTFVGIDVGGTKCAAGLVTLPAGTVLARRLEPTRPERGGAAVLSSVIEIALSLLKESTGQGIAVRGIGLGVAELVGLDGRIQSATTIRWQDTDVAEALRDALGRPVTIDADVRAAARAEAGLGAGRPFASFLYVTVGTGISASFVQGRDPYAGARGLTGTFASSRGLIPSDAGDLVTGPQLEQFAAGPALAARLTAARPDFAGTAVDVVAESEAGEAVATGIVESAGAALGAAIAQLVNVLDPAAVVIGGGLGLTDGRYRASLEAALRRYIWSDLHRDLPLRSAELGVDAGFIGAALAAAHQQESHTA
jgi:glucokinase